MPPRDQQLASDNISGASPEVIAAITEANAGYADSYGGDMWSKKATELIKEKFECDCEVFFAYTGTSANSLIIAQLCPQYRSIIAADTAHIVTDECGAPGFFTAGSPILPVSNVMGKITPEAIEELVTTRSDTNYPKPKVVSITQSTECGTCYTIDEVTQIAEQSHRHGLLLHMDGARFANALVSQNCSPADLSWRAGVDAMVFGCSKNGGMLGEAVIFFKKELAEDFISRCKHTGQLGSKLRFVSAQYVALLENDRYLANASHANKMAKILADALCELPGVSLTLPADANELFVKVPSHVAEYLEKVGWHFCTYIADGIRLVTSWDTKQSTIDEFLADCRIAIKG